MRRGMALPRAVGSCMDTLPEVVMIGKASLVDRIDNLRYLRKAGKVLWFIMLLEWFKYDL